MQVVTYFQDFQMPKGFFKDIEPFFSHLSLKFWPSKGNTHLEWYVQILYQVVHGISQFAQYRVSRTTPPVCLRLKVVHTLQRYSIHGLGIKFQSLSKHTIFETTSHFPILASMEIQEQCFLGDILSVLKIIFVT